MRWSKLFALTLSVALVAGCQSDRSKTAAAAPVPATTSAPDTVEGTVVGDDRTAMEAAVDAGASNAAPTSEPVQGAPAINPNAPDSYVVKRGDTLWGIAKVFLRDPWFWPEIWQVNPQVQNPHLIYPGDTLRLVYINGRPTLMLQRGDAARVLPRVRSQPLEGAVTTIPYETVAAFMSKPTVLAQEQIKVRHTYWPPVTCTWSWRTATPCMRVDLPHPLKSALITTWCASAMPCVILTTAIASWATTASLPAPAT